MGHQAFRPSATARRRGARPLLAGLLACAAVLGLGAGEAPPAPTPPAAAPASPAVAVVNGKPITLRVLEDELLKREGAELVEEMVHGQLEGMAWSELGDGDSILAMGEWRLSRGMLAAQLLRTSAPKVREELINIALVQQALDAAGVAVDQAQVDAEVARMDARLQQGLAAKGQPQVDFASFIQQTQKMTVADFTRQPGFRMLVGLHLLVQRRAKAELGDAELKSWFEAHRARYRVLEGVDLSIIHIPYQVEPDAEGKPMVTPAERARLASVMRQLHGGIAAKPESFPRIWAAFARAYDPHAQEGGRLGWVARDGGRGIAHARRIPVPVVEAAFAAEQPWPRLLAPIDHAEGIDVVMVHGRRAASDPDFATLRERILSDLVESELETRTKALLDSLRRSSTIDYVSMPDLIRKREQDTGLPPAGGAVPAPAPVSSPAPASAGAPAPTQAP